MTMKRISLIFAAALALAGLSAKAADSLTMADFGHKIKLQVSGYTGTETLQNFPVLVRISENLGDWDAIRQLRADGKLFAKFEWPKEAHLV